jgi:hypothetical protein
MYVWATLPVIGLSVVSRTLHSGFRGPIKYRIGLIIG